jgi:hypothetical protein
MRVSAERHNRIRQRHHLLRQIAVGIEADGKRQLTDDRSHPAE